MTNDQLQTFRRLLLLYERLEQQHVQELQQAAAATNATEAAIYAEELNLESARRHRREALMNDDEITERSFANAQEEMAKRRQRKLEPLLREREKQREAARHTYQGSRMWSERIRNLVDQASDQIAVEHTKRAQAFSDDLFLAGRGWKSRLARRDR